jgi:hypothetical protein
MVEPVIVGLESGALGGGSAEHAARTIAAISAIGPAIRGRDGFDGQSAGMPNRWAVISRSS